MGLFSAMMNEGMGVKGTSCVALGRIDVESDIEPERRSPGGTLGRFRLWAAKPSLDLIQWLTQVKSHGRPREGDATFGTKQETIAPEISLPYI